jgi:hypothetical protein
MVQPTQFDNYGLDFFIFALYLRLNYETLKFKMFYKGKNAIKIINFNNVSGQDLSRSQLWSVAGFAWCQVYQHPAGATLPSIRVPGQIFGVGGLR